MNQNEDVRDMSDSETAEHLRQWVRETHQHSMWSWPTDACGYKQHLRFVKHRNECWDDGDWRAFVLAYADKLDGGER